MKNTFQYTKSYRGLLRIRSCHSNKKMGCRLCKPAPQKVMCVSYDLLCHTIFQSSILRVAVEKLTPILKSFLESPSNGLA